MDQVAGWRGRGATFGLALLLVVLGCAAPAAPTSSGSAVGSGGAAERPAGLKRIVMAVSAEPPALYYQLLGQSNRTGPGAFLDVVNVGLTVIDHEGALRPILAEQVPTVENGLWKIFPDGKMETTWRLRPGVVWHDGTPMTSDDLLFTANVVRDRDLAIFRDRVYDAIESVEAPDTRTITIKWRRPLVEGDTMFIHSRGMPMPKHLLEQTYLENKASFVEAPYWSTEFIGTGPFRLKDWVRGSHAVFSRFDAYVLGAPKLDEIEVRFITDSNTIISNVLAGAVDLTMQNAISLDQALQIKAQWTDGKVQTASDGWVTVYTQFVNPVNPVVTNLQFRRALLHAIDRQQLVDSLMSGTVEVAHTPLHPGTAVFRATESGVTKYAYDPQRAQQLLDGLGYRKGQDGVLRDAGGQRLSLPTWTFVQRDIHQKTTFPVVDYWKAIGLDSEITVQPAQVSTDRELQSTFPALHVLRQASGTRRLAYYHSNEARLPENSFVGNNNGRYSSTDMDVLVDRYLLTIAETERMQIATQIVRHITEQLPVLGLFYDGLASLQRNKLRNIAPISGAEESRQAWSAHEWDVAS